MIAVTKRLFGKSVTRYSRTRTASKRKMVYGNDTSAFRPEMWAQESIRLLWENMAMASTVFRDFDNEIAQFGDTVHTRKISSFVGKRKQNDLDTLVDQDAGATKVDVKLDQRVYITFLLGDGERSKSFKNLVNTYLEPAVLGNARMLDQVVAGQAVQFMGNRCGALGQLTSSNGYDYLMDARKVMNDKKVGDQGRWMALASGSETQMQKNPMFKQAYSIGDSGVALRNAMLGYLGGFNTFLGLNTPSVTGATLDTATTTAAAAAAGATTVSSTATVVTGKYIVIAGDYTPLRVTAVSGSGPFTLTLDRPLLRGVASGAALQSVSAGAINQTGAIAAGDTTAAVSNGYPAGWMKDIEVDGTGAPVVGQLVAFKAAGGTLYTPVYTIVQVNGTAIVLDRPLESTVADNDIVNYGPNGDYNFFYQREALALVNRPLALPEAGTGVRAAVGTYNDMSLRVTISYDSNKQATRVTVDGLFGVKVLNTDLGGVMYG